MIGIVVVSHSHTLAQAAIALASDMGGGQAPLIVNAAGLDETTLGTDAAKVADAVTGLAETCDGVLVLVDLGSAILSAEMACEFLDPDVAARVRISSAPLVEGLVSAVVAASTGAGLADVDRQAREALAPKVAQLGDADADDSTGDDAPDPDMADAVTFETVITNPHGLHARPAAALVSALGGLDARVTVANRTSGRGPVVATSLNQVATLGLRQGDTMAITASGPDADRVIDAIRELAHRRFGEATDSPDAPQAPAPSCRPGSLIVIGPVRRVVPTTAPSDPADATPRSELARLDAALDAVAQTLAAKAAGEHGEIFGAQRVMLADPTLRESLTAAVRDGRGAAAAAGEVLDGIAADYESLSDAYQRERAQDVRSLRDQLWAALGGRQPGAEATDPAVLIMPTLDAATASTLDLTTTLGVITTEGGATGHGALVAASRGIPVLAGRPEATELSDGDQVAFDPLAGDLWLRPDASVTDELTRRNADLAAREDAAAQAASDPAVTREGRRLAVEANVASLDDAVRAAAQGADGVGLVRTELLFAGTKAPTVEQQAEAFVAIGRALDGRPITIRTWDIGGDKPSAFYDLPHESNPFLGERGLRAMPRNEALFRDQLRAIVLAAGQTPVRVMFPMVTEPAELEWARGVLDQVKTEVDADVDLPVGIMIEVPAAALRAGEFDVDFVSVGTNDLTQYTTATDRSNAAVSSLARPDSPAVLELIGMTCRALAGRPVAVCGDLASDPTAAAALVGLGVSELSVRPPLVGLVKQAVREVGASG